MGTGVSRKNFYELDISSGLKVKTEIKPDVPRKITKSKSLCWKIGFSILILALVFNVIAAIIVWFTNLYYETLHKVVSFHEDGFIFKLWVMAIPKLISVYPFNYTNAEAIMKGLEVPHVQQIGPYVFREVSKKVNIEFHDNGTFTSQDNRTHEFVPELSNGSLSDTIILPNFPVLAAHNMEGAGVLEWSGVAFLKLATFPNDFLRITVNDIIWGYDDRFTKVTTALKSFLMPEKESRKFGILTLRNGLNPDRVTMGTGVPNLDNFSIVTRYNGKPNIGAWKDEQCDSIGGTDGTLFPWRKVSRKNTLDVFAKELCRKVQMVYEQDILTEDGIPAYRYILPGNTFETTANNPENKCYCRNSVCSPSGTFNTAPCNFRLPVLMSFPHFTYADPSLMKKVSGLSPDPEKYQSFVDVHKFGVTVNGVSRLQVNFFINDSGNTPWLNLTDGSVLPLAWIEMKNGKFTPLLTSLLYHLSYTVPKLELILRYGTLICITIIIIVLIKMNKLGKCRVINLQ